MAIIKHKAMRSADYNAAVEYLEYEHSSSGETLKDEYGIPQLRENFIIEGINCEPLSFNNECHRINELYKKNQKRNEVKSHSYIISFDPRDSIDNGLTLEEVQKFGIEFVQKYMPGYQTIVCSHADGANGSGNMHCHIVINSIRIADVNRETYMDQPTDNIAGFKHRCTPDFERFIKEKIMEMCQERGLYQVNLLEPADERINDREYYLNLRKQSLEGKSYQTRKEFIRCAIRDCAAKSNDLAEYKSLMKSVYDIRVYESRGRFSYILPGRERGITERQLGVIYTKVFVDKVINHEEIYYDRSEQKPYRSEDYISPSVQKLIDIAANEKAKASKGYEHVLLLSNLKKSAETFNVLSEKGIRGSGELDEVLLKIQSLYTETAKEVRMLEHRIDEIKDIVHLKTEITKLQPVIDELKSGKQSARFRKEHEADLVIYKAAKEKLKQIGPELKNFSEKNLSEELAVLTQRKNILYEQHGQMKKDIRNLENAKANLQYLRGETKDKKREVPELER